MGAIASPDTIDATVIATIYKNRSEEVRVSLNEYAGRKLISLWVWYEDPEGVQHPGKAGINMRASAIPELIEALQDAEAEALRREWISQGRAPE